MSCPHEAVEMRKMPTITFTIESAATATIITINTCGLCLISPIRQDGTL